MAAAFRFQFGLELTELEDFRFSTAEPSSSEVSLPLPSLYLTPCCPPSRACTVVHWPMFRGGPSRGGLPAGWLIVEIVEFFRGESPSSPSIAELPSTPTLNSTETQPPVPASYSAEGRGTVNCRRRDAGGRGRFRRRGGDDVQCFITSSCPRSHRLRGGAPLWATTRCRRRNDRASRARDGRAGAGKRVDRSAACERPRSRERRWKEAGMRSR